MPTPGTGRLSQGGIGKAAPKVTDNASFQRLRNHVYTYGGFTGSDEDHQTLQREHPKLQLTETPQRMRVAAGFTKWAVCSFSPSFPLWGCDEAGSSISRDDEIHVLA